MDEGDMSHIPTSTTADDVSSSSVFGQEHHRHGILLFLLHSTRGLAIFISVSFTLFLMFGMLICLCIKCLRKQKNDNIPATSAFSTPSSFVPNQFGDSENGHVKSRVRMLPHKNIITPDKSIAFVVPTVRFLIN